MSTLRVALVAGQVTHLSAKDFRNFRDLFSALIEGKPRYAAQLMIERSRHATNNAVQTGLGLTLVVDV